MNKSTVICKIPIGKVIMHWPEFYQNSSLCYLDAVSFIVNIIYNLPFYLHVNINFYIWEQRKRTFFFVKNVEVEMVLCFEYCSDLLWEKKWLRNIVRFKLNDNLYFSLFYHFWQFYCHWYVYLSQNWGSDSHFEVLNQSKSQLVQKLWPQM